MKGSTKKGTIRTQPRAKKGASKAGPVSKDSGSSGGCRQFLCDLVTLRVLGYVLKQPPSCTYIITLFVVSGCLPFIGLYISNQPILPDLDAMQNWNAYIGKIGHNVYCYKVEPLKYEQNLSSLLPRYPPFNKTTSTNNTFLTTCVNDVKFSVGKSLIVSDKEILKNVFLVGNFNGTEIGTQIKNSSERIDDQVYVHFIIRSKSIINTTEACAGDYCTVNGTVLITAPPGARPTRLPQVHKDHTFKTKVYECQLRCPAGLCKSDSYDQTIPKDTEISMITKHNECGSETSQFSVINKHKFGAKVNGIIKIYLSSDDKGIAAYHMYLAAIAVAALSLTFTIGIILTDRPTDPKASLA